MGTMTVWPLICLASALGTCSFILLIEGWERIGGDDEGEGGGDGDAEK